MAEATSLDALASMMKLFTGNSKTQSGGSITESQSTQTNLKDEDIAALLRTALESNSGLASVTQGQKAAGLFNSTSNKLLTNDLLARLTAQTASQAAGKTSSTTRTMTPQVTKEGGSDLMTKGAMALTAYQKLIKPALETKMGKKAVGVAGDAGQSALEMITNAFADSGSPINTSMLGGGQSFADNSAVGSLMGVGAVDLPQATSIDWSNAPSASSAESNFDFSSFLADQSMGSGGQSFAPDSATANLLGSSAGEAPQSSAIDWNNIPSVTSEAVEDTTNFPVASGTSSASSSSGNASASEVLSEASKTTLSTSQLLSGAGGSALSLYSGISSLSDGNSDNDLVGAMSTGAGAYGAYRTYEAYQAAQAAAQAAAAANAANAASTASTAADASTASTASSSGGSILGYIGPVISALTAQDNPKGEQEKDYRHAVGSAVLNYFGFGWAAPIVHEVAEPVLNASMGAGVNSLGTFGAVMADPVGAPLSGQYDVGDLVTSTLDPANIFGGNEGGSSGALVAASLDPIGAALGDTGANQFIRDTIDNNPISDAIGKVICTELTMQDKLPLNLYAASVSPKYIMKGRILTGYHVWGVSFVRALRKSERLSAWIAPYVVKYIEHKSGIRPNWQGFWIKNIMHPICWMLSFISSDKYKYLNLYRRERKSV